MKRLTGKQHRFVNEYAANGGNATQAALTAYDTTYGTARVIGCENLTKPNIRAEIQKLMENTDLRVEDALHTIYQALHEATNIQGQPDWSNRLRAAEMTLKLADAYPSKRTQEQTELHQHLHLEAKEELRTRQIKALPLPVLQFMAEAEGALPSESQWAYLSGDDTKWDEALADGQSGMTADELERFLRLCRPAYSKKHEVNTRLRT